MDSVSPITKVQIDKVDWFLGKELKEGTVFFSIGDKKFRAFSFLSDFDENSSCDVEFSFLDFDARWEDIFSKNTKKKKEMIPIGDNWDYECFGQIISVNPNLADFGGVVMEVGMSLNEKIIGEYIWLPIQRFQISKVTNDRRD
ncbi:MAG TPA: hypothetical protein VI112_15685 [Bacteroidia bacterium]